MVERGRRLEVIDTTTGEAAKPSASVGPAGSRAEAGRWPSWPEQEGFDGRALLVTHPWYDAKAPRRVLLDGATAQRIGMAKVAAMVSAVVMAVVALAAPVVLALLLLPLALLRAPVRDTLRAAATRWLDRFGEPPGR